MEHQHDHKQHEHSHDNHDSHGGHHDHHAHMIEDFEKRFYINTALSVPVLAFSEMIQGILGFSISFQALAM